VAVRRERGEPESGLSSSSRRSRLGATMQRFTELPPELVARIIELSATVSDPGNPLEVRRGRRLVDSLSRVHSTWTPVAQRLLLGRDPVRLYHRREYAPFARLARHRLAKLPRLVKRVDLELWGEDQDDDLAHVLRECDGLDELVLTYVERVHLDQVAAGSSASPDFLLLLLLRPRRAR